MGHDLEIKKQIAADARRRWAEAKTCPHCEEQAKLEHVLRLLENWSKTKRKL